MRLKFLTFFLCALVAITGAYAPAQACFPCWFWGASTAPRQAASDQVREGSPALQLIAADLDPVVEPYGIRESEIRKAFDTAYHKQQFASEDAKTVAYEKWKDTIGSATENDGGWKYVYERQGPLQITNRGMVRGQVAYIEADLYPDSSIAFAVRAPAKGFDAQLGLELGLERESGAGFFARMFVAFGGREAVKKLRASWFEGNDNYRSFRTQRKRMDVFDAANETFTGKMASRFYGLSAQKIRPRNTGDAYEVTFLPEPVVPSDLR